MKSLDLSQDKKHLEVKLAIKNSWKNKIPSTGITAVVANLSAVGEQYVDLQPTSDTAPFLREGDQIKGGTIPISNDVLLLNLDKLVNSVDRKQLAAVITYLDQAFAGTGPDLARLIARGDSLTQAVTDALPQTVRLINDGVDRARHATDVAGDLKSFAADLAKLSDTIRTDDPAYRLLIDNGVKSAQQLDSLVEAERRAAVHVAEQLGDGVRHPGRAGAARWPPHGPHGLPEHGLQRIQARTR